MGMKFDESCDGVCDYETGVQWTETEAQQCCHSSRSHSLPVMLLLTEVLISGHVVILYI